jgi:hypothetical protein
MKNSIPEYLSNKIEEIPEGILRGHLRESSAKRLMVLESLKVMEAGKGIVFSEEEFTSNFGKHGKISLVTYLRKNGLKKAGITKMNGRVYVYLRSKV